MSESLGTQAGPEPRRRSSRASGWLPNQDEANEAIETCRAAAEHAVETHAAFDTGARDLCFALYDLIYAVIPPPVMTGLRQSWEDDNAVSDEEKVSIPRNVQLFLKQHDLPPPPLRSANPFLGWFQAFWGGAAIARRKRGDVGGMTDAEVKQAAEDAADIRKLRLERAAENTMISRYAKLVLAAVDMGDRNLVSRGFREVFERYATFQKHNPTLVGKPTVQRGRKPKAGAPESSSSSSSSSGSTAEEFLDSEEGYDPFKDAAAPDISADTTKDAPDTGADTEAEKQFDKDLTAKTEEAKAKAAEEPVIEEPVEEPVKAEEAEPVKAEEAEPVKAEGSVKIGAIELTTSPRPGIELTAPAPLELSTPQERASSPQLIIDVDGKQVTIRHRKVPEKHLSFSNQSIAEVVPDEGLLRYRKDGGRIVVMEIMDWTE